MALTAKQKREAREREDAEAAAQGRPSTDQVQEINKSAMLSPGSVADAHGRGARPESSGAKVIVACKLGVAYFDIQLCKIVDKFEQNMQGGRMVKEASRVGKVVRLRGTAYPRGTPPEGFPERPEIIAGAAINRGIDKEWFDEWLEQNKQNPLVVNGMIFAHESFDHVRGKAEELAGVMSGLDPINPKKDPRMVKSTRADVSNIEGAKATADTSN